MKISLSPLPLTSESFAPFGDVIEADGRPHFSVNDGTAWRFNDLARVEAAEDGVAALSIFRAAARKLPLRIEMLERHPLGSQAFVPMTARRFAVVVAPLGDEILAESLRAFVVEPGRGINFRRGVWHYPLIALDSGGDFLVADRIGPGDNLEKRYFPDDVKIILNI